MKLYYTKKIYCLFILISISISSYSQNLHLNLFAGVANYKGDLQYNSSSGKQFTLRQPRPAVGIGAEYEITDKLFLRGGFTLGKINADDKKGYPDQVARNLNFTSPITDVMLGGGYYFFNLNEYLLSPYVFAGIAFFHFNPYTYDTSNQKVYLQPLSTEGQGFVAGREVYKLSQFSIPFGGGVKMSLTENIRMGVEVGIRKTFTDFLDDVSGTYVDENLLLTNRSQQAVDLAFRGYEVKSGTPYPAASTARGTSITNDWYYFTGFTFSYRLGSDGGGRKGKYGCPKVN
jgi:opacity protein-like surface antigen